MYENIKKHIRDIPDFPQKGILFKDITPALQNAKCYKEIIDSLYNTCNKYQIDKIVAIESRGYLLGAPLAHRLNCGLVLLRKPGKLPYQTISESYGLEYGKDALEVHIDAIKPNENILLIDDLLATGGTAQAALNLIKKLGGKPVAAAFLIELTALKGASRLSSTNIISLLQY